MRFERRVGCLGSMLCFPVAMFLLAPKGSASAGSTLAVSRVVVVDIDSAAPEASAAVSRRFGDTPRVARTPRGGQHHYYAHPGTVVPNAVRLSAFDFPVELRGDGGYVLAPPSAGHEWERAAPRTARVSR